MFNKKHLSVAAGIVFATVSMSSQAAVVFTDNSWTSIGGWVDDDISNTTATAEYSSYASGSTGGTSAFAMGDLQYVELLDLSAYAESDAYVESSYYNVGSASGIFGYVESSAYADMTNTNQDSYAYGDAVVDVNFTLDGSYNYDFFGDWMNGNNNAEVSYWLYNYETDSNIFSGTVIDNPLDEFASLNGSLGAGSYKFVFEALSDADGYLAGTAGNGFAYGDFALELTAVPVPAAVWLFASGLLGLAGFARRKA